MTATLHWFGIHDNAPFATVEQVEGQYVWKWLIDEPKKVLEYFFRLMFCTNCGHRHSDSVLAQANDGSKYTISQLQNVFFNCQIIVHKV